MIRLAYLHALYFGVICAAGALIFLLWAERRYRERATSFARPRTLGMIDPSYARRHAVLRICLAAGSILFISIALARPQWGFYWTGASESGRDIVFALDLSRSMSSQDTAPDRISRAKDEIADLAMSSKGDRLALIGFSGDAFLFCPLTMNHDSFLRVLEDLRIGSVKRGGTSYYSLIETAARSFRGAATDSKILVILSDGEDTEGSVDKAIDEAKKEGIVIYAVGVGTASGGLIPVVGKDSKNAFLKDDKGVLVRTRLDETMLKRLAQETGGAYEAEGARGGALKRLSAIWGLKSEASAAQETFGRVYKERFQIPLLLAFLALASELFISMANRGNRQ